MTDYSDWQIRTYRDGESEVEHQVCSDSYDLTRTETVQHLLAVIDGHECTGPPAPYRHDGTFGACCVHGAPIDKCKQHGPATVTIPIVR